MQKQKKELPKIGAVVVTFNSESYILDALKSLVQTKYPRLSIVIIDNDSKDLTVSVIKNFNKKIHLIRNNKNLGFIKASNQGIQYFLNRVDYVLLLNPDTSVSPKLFEELLKPFSKNKKIMTACPLITYLKDTKKIWYAGGYFNKLFFYTRHLHMNKYLNAVNLLSGVTDFNTGACILIKKEAFKKVKYLQIDFFLYFEDTSFCIRLKEKGYLNYFVAKPLVRHLVSPTIGIAGSNYMSSERAYYFARNPLLYIRKNNKGFIKLTCLFGQIFIRLPHYFLQILKQGNISAFMFYMRGFSDGIRGISGEMRS